MTALLIRENLCRMPKSIRDRAEEMVRAVLNEYNSVSNVRVTTDAGPGFVMLDANANAATDRAMKAGVTWLLRYEMTRVK